MASGASLPRLPNFRITSSFCILCKNFNAGMHSRRLVTLCSRISPWRSTARQRQESSPLIFPKTSSRCHAHFEKFCSAARFLRICAANIARNRFHQTQTVSYGISMPRSCSKSPRFRSENGNRICIITARRLGSGAALKYMSGLRIP